MKLYCIKECKIPDFGHCKVGRVVEVEVKPQTGWTKFFSEHPDREDPAANLRLLGQSGIRVRSTYAPTVKASPPSTTLDLT